MNLGRKTLCLSASTSVRARRLMSAISVHMCVLAFVHDLRMVQGKELGKLRIFAAFARGQNQFLF